MPSDGGLSDARTRLNSAGAAEKRERAAAAAAIKLAVHERDARVTEAITAFLRTAEELFLKPERFLHARRKIGDPPKVRFWQQERPAPTEPVYKYGFVIYRWRTLRGDSGDDHNVVLWTSGTVELDYAPGTSRQRTLPTNGIEGVLPFHLRSDEMRDGAVHDGHLGGQLKTVKATADWFVERLAMYLEESEHPVRGLWR